MSRKKQTPVVKTTTNGISDITIHMSKMGDQLTDMWNATWDLSAAKTGIQAYRTAIAAAKTQVIYKKLTAKPAEIPFLER
jgi:hypothetical protein